MHLPRFPEKFNDEPLFRADAFLAYLEKVGVALSHRPAPDGVIISYQKSLFDHVVDTYPTERARGYFGNVLHYVEVPECRRTLAIAAGFGIGAPAAAVLAEELIAWGTKSFVSMGFAGSLRQDLPPGSLVVCDGAFRDEGTSSHYLKDEAIARPDPSLTARLMRALDEAGLQYAVGPSWTIDAIYRETPVEIVGYREMGALVVEMEAAALFAVASHRGAAIASCFSVSDTLAELSWRPEFHSEPSVQGLERLFACAARALDQD
ncbi:MAG: nucleoside phosphorylase [Spirochaetaceae bacterium]|nr:nucleoside phosphorylase [Spirochaetaceae bacterium]